MQFHGELEFNQSQLSNVVLQNVATPSVDIISPVLGQVAYDTTLGRVVTYNGSNWISDVIPSTIIDYANLTPASWAVDQNNLALPAVGWRATPTGNIDITGIIAGTAWQQVTIYNASTFTIKLKHDDALSSANNRIFCPGGGDYNIIDYVTTILTYDPILLKWIVLSTSIH